jgi:hypothetical protein
LIAQAYFDVDQIVPWEGRYLDATIGMTSTLSMTVSGGAPMPLKQFVFALMNPTYASAQSAVTTALQKL